MRYRVRQGLNALFAASQPVDLALAAQVLPPALLDIFQRMRRSEQLHSLKVFRTIQAHGSTPEDLAVAALLHDAGKSRYSFPVWQKTLVVLTRAFAPGLYGRLSTGDAAKWLQRPFVLSAQHPAWGADMVAAAGGSPRTVWLIAHHADPSDQWATHPDRHLLKRLQAADDAH